jgi:hypothetical protein
MKPFLLLMVWLTSPLGSFGQVVTNDLYPAKLAVDAQRCFATTRSEVAAAIEAPLKGKSVALTDLDAILAVLGTQSNKLYQAGFDRRLDLAMRQVETVRTQVAAVLNDPANKAMAARLEPQQWLDHIALLLAVGKILETDMVRLRGTIEELRRWADLLEPVAPPGEVAAALQSRLAELLSEWNRSQPAIHQNSEGLEAQVADRQTQRRAYARKAAGTVSDQLGGATDSSRSAALVERTAARSLANRVNRISPSVAAVLKAAETGATEEQMLGFVDRYPWPFNLDVDQILHLRGKVPSAVICRILQHDGALRPRAHE